MRHAIEVGHKQTVCGIGAADIKNWYELINKDDYGLIKSQADICVKCREGMEQLEKAK